MAPSDKQSSHSPHNDLLDDSLLGRETDYPAHYAPNLLYPVSRGENRRSLGFDAWPYHGVDRWYAYELSWLQPGGLPAVAVATLDVPAHSPNLIESKSLKLYLNSFNMTRFESREAVAHCMASDLSQAAQAEVQVRLHDVDAVQTRPPPGDAVLLDNNDIEVEQYDVAPTLLRLDAARDRVDETLYSHLLRSNCPVTGQPDWGTLFVSYEGPALDRISLLRYLVSFRQHTEFHEHCVERVLTDILALGEFDRLQVWAHYLRRGGLDINPYRSLSAERTDLGRLGRQ